MIEYALSYTLCYADCIASHRDHQHRAAVFGAAAIAFWTLSQASSVVKDMPPAAGEQTIQGAQVNPRKDAVLVFGASGRLGQELVTEVLCSSPISQLLEGLRHLSYVLHIHYTAYTVLHAYSRHTYHTPYT